MTTSIHLASLNQSLRWNALPDTTRFTLDQALAIQQIPAPTFHEAVRAQYVAEQFQLLGLETVEVDALGNVYGLLRGTQPELPALMVSAHLDTIFAADTNLTAIRANDRISAPGLGDNSVGAAALLALPYFLRSEGIKPVRSLWIVATTREEGLGDLGGMRAAFAHLRENVYAVVNLEGLAFGHVYHGGIAVRRLHIQAKTEGGHSWLHFGRPSAVHVIAQLGARIAALQPPASPRTTFNIGMIEGGDAINAIATHASLWLDMRSESLSALETLEASVRSEINTLRTDDLTFEIVVVGDRPAGSIPHDHPIVRLALEALAAVNVRGTLEIGSTDGNIPLAEGTPAVTIGITRGGNAHRLDEFIEIAPISSGLRQMLLLVLALAGEQGAFG